jgi:hypothetical protein
MPKTDFGEYSLLNKWCRENWISISRRLKQDPYVSPYTKINSNCIKDLNVRPALNILEKNLGETLKDTRIGNDFLNKIPTAQDIIARIYKCKCIKLESFYTQKRNRVKRQPTK